jgi:serine/threonine-protein kinase
VQPDVLIPVEPRIIGRYALYDEIASGGMATVHLGRLLGSAGFSRTVAIKRLHPQFAKDTDFVSMFVDEARVAARIHHPNVVSTLDVVSTDGELFLVMEYIIGESLGRLIPLTRQKGERIPPPVAATIMAGVLHGLHAAHEARDEQGVPLGIVHRDVSPQNVIVGVDGTARVLDFGVAKAAGRLQTTREGQLKGKIAYMAPEQIQGIVDRTTDVYAASVVLWETLTAKRLFHGESEVEAMRKVLDGRVEPPSKYAADVPPALEQIILRGLDRDPANRFPTAGEMALAIEDAMPMVAASKIGRWVEQTATQRLAARIERIASMESNSAIRGPGSANEQQLTAAFPKPLSEAVSAPSGGSGVSGVVSAPLLAPQPAPPVSPAGPSRAVLIAVGLAVVATVGAVVGGVVLLKQKGHGSAPVGTLSPASTESNLPVPPLDSASTLAPTLPAESPAEPTAPVATVAVTALPSVAPVKPPPAIPPVGAAPAHTQVPVPQARPTAQAPTGPHPATDCNPPYYFNAQGDRIFKKDCL